jgi:Spy/CpxP family protein refolding chaperone
MPAAAGGVLAYEGRVFPDQMDMRDVNLTPEQRQQAISNIFDGGGFAMNALMGGLTGLSAQEAVDRLVPAKRPDVEKATAVRDRLQRYRRSR